MKNLKIPISMAKEVSTKYNYPEVVIFAYDPETKMQHITTYGKNKEYCLDAKLAGDFLKKALHWEVEK
jgi:hypothetical protein